MRKLIFLLKEFYHLMIAYKELRFQPISCFRFSRLYIKKKISVQEYWDYYDILKDQSFRDSFLSYREAEKFWLVLNPNKYSAVARDKYITHLVLGAASIPMPKLYAYYNYEADKDYNHIRELLYQQGVSQCVIKPAADSAHGSGVFVCENIHFEDQDCILEKTNGELLSLKQLLEDSRFTPLLFEERVNQTEQMRIINPSSVNTLRIMTALYPNNEVQVVGNFMRMGRKGSDVDNAGNGGNVDCTVNDNGICYNTVQFNSFSDIRHITNHPDSNSLVEGLVIENWTEIIEKVKDFQSRIPFIKMIGWDIALTDKGPIVIEINNWWDTTGQLFIGKGWRDKVVACYDAWTNHYKNIEK